MKVVTVVGARPQFIKSLPVSLAFREAGIQELLVHTGQHYDRRMSEVFFEQLGLGEPAHNLNVGSGSHAEQTAKMLVGLETYLLKHRPDALVLFGDTNSTLAGALVAAKLGIPIGHIEAGLRSFDRRMPEEINREVTDRLSEWLFVPTPTGRENLLREGVADGKIYPVGDVMYDTFLSFQAKAPPLAAVLPEVETGPFALMTIHRPENTDNPERLKLIGQAIQKVAQHIPVVFPVHPRTRKMFSEAGAWFENIPGLHLLEPQGYLELLALLCQCQLVITDSGGLQKEAFFAQKSCVVLRENTEWVELLETGWNTLLPPETTVDLANQISSRIGRQGTADPAYGKGDAAKKIAQILVASFPKSAVHKQELANSSHERRDL